MDRTSFKTSHGNVNSVSLQLFLDTFLPRSAPSDTRIDDLLRAQKRKRSPAHKLVTKNGRLWGYAQKTPSSLDHARAFTPIRRCMSELGKVCAKQRPPLQFRHTAERVTGSSDLKRYPDAFFYAGCRLGDATRRPHWNEILVPGAYQQCASCDEVTENNKAIVRWMTKCMTRNPCRRFVYGFTIEDARMRLWYCDRSQIVSSQPFNYITDCRPFLRLALFSMFSEPYDLGIDPTMTPAPVDKDGEAQYDISVYSGTSGVQVYRTLSVLFDTGSDDILARGTRVWKAKKVENGEAVGSPVVLKDCWVDAHREREGDIDARIRKSAVVLHDNDRQRLVDMLLTVLDHGDVLVAGRPDSTPLLNISRKRKLYGPPKSGQMHYRIVYREVCKSLRDETSLPVVFSVMVDLCAGLYSLHHCGWVHGDISANNILLHGDRAILSDLEYAKRRGEVEEHDGIGTHNFMPVELQLHRYLFASSILYGESPEPAQTNNEPNSVSSGSSSNTLGKNIVDSEPDLDLDSDLDLDHFDDAPPLIHRPRNPIYSVPIRYNPRHDLEGLLWVSLSFVFLRAVPGALEAGDAGEEGLLDRQKKSAWRLFLRGDDREDALTTNRCLPGHFRSLHPTIRDATWPLDIARKAIASSYIKLEQKYTEQKEFDVPRSLYETMRRAFCTVSEQLRPSGIEVEPLEIDC